MTQELFDKLIEHEIQWINYYGLAECRQHLTEESNIYCDVKSIGWTKRIVDLKFRCSPGLITSDLPITLGLEIDRLVSVSFPEGYNKFTPIETYFILYPDKKKDFIEKLIPKPHIHKIYIDFSRTN